MYGTCKPKIAEKIEEKVSFQIQQGQDDYDSRQNDMAEEKIENVLKGMGIDKNEIDQAEEIEVFVSEKNSIFKKSTIEKVDPLENLIGYDNLKVSGIE